MTEKELVAYFVDGTPVDLGLMEELGLIRETHQNEYVLTEFGRSYL